MLTIELGGLGASAIAVRFYGDVGKVSARGSKIVRRERFSSVLSPPPLNRIRQERMHAVYLSHVEPFILIAMTQYARTGLA